MSCRKTRSTSDIGRKIGCSEKKCWTINLTIHNIIQRKFIYYCSAISILLLKPNDHSSTNYKQHNIHNIIITACGLIQSFPEQNKLALGTWIEQVWQTRAPQISCQEYSCFLHILKIESGHSSSELRGEQLRESERRSRGERLWGVGDRLLGLRPFGLLALGDGVLRGDKLLLGLMLSIEWLLLLRRSS